MSESFSVHEPGPAAYVAASVVLLGVAYGFFLLFRTLLRCGWWTASTFCLSPLGAVYRWLRRKRPLHPEHMCRDCQIVAVTDSAPASRIYCTEPRQVRSKQRTMPYCVDHMRVWSSARTEAARRFDCSRYPFAMLTAYDNDDDNDDGSGSPRPSSPRRHKPGFVVVYLCREDVAQQAVDVDKIDDHEPFFYRLRYTRQSAYACARKQAGALFATNTWRGIEGVDYWRSDNPREAMRQLHKQLSTVHYCRFENERVVFQKNWFLLSYKRLQSAIENAIAQTDLQVQQNKNKKVLYTEQCACFVSLLD